LEKTDSTHPQKARAAALPQRPPPARWVLDTNVLLDWLIFADAGVAPLVARIESGAITLLTRADCRDEFVRVLDYPQVQKRGAARSTALAVYDRWHVCCAAAPDTGTDGGHDTAGAAGGKDLVRAGSGTPTPRPLSPTAPALPLCRDPDDQKFLELARAARADWLISKDRALLDLARRVRLTEAFEILGPQDAVRRLGLTAGPAGPETPPTL